VGAIHLDLWLGGYRQLPTDGPLFLADAIAGFALAASLLAWPRPLVALLGTGFMVSTLVGLTLSINVGLFGFQESIRASFVVESILLESIGAISLLAWTVIVVQTQPKRRQGTHRR
jgi:membrane-bound ClpP family serine protease